MIRVTYVLQGIEYDHLHFRSYHVCKRWVEALLRRGAVCVRIVA